MTKLHVSVDGYTDSVGSDAYNQKLSMRRAEAARRYLVDKGIDESRISVRAMGESNPVASNSTADGRAENRRVEIIAQ
jgi:OmpA-OmpF porin, OOP family